MAKKHLSDCTVLEWMSGEAATYHLLPALSLRGITIGNQMFLGMQDFDVAQI